MIIGWGIGALAALRYAERHPVLALVLLAPSPPAGALPRGPNEHELADVPDVYDADWWGWVASVERLREWMPDMTDFELEKMQEMIAGAHESGSARRERMRGVEIDPLRITAPTLVIGAGLDDVDLEQAIVMIQQELFAVGARLADPSARIAGRVVKAVVARAAIVETFA